MEKSKDFKGNTAMSFISQESIDAVDGKQARTKQEAPAGYKPNPEYIEIKSKRVQLLVQPSVVDAIKALAKREGLSMNEAVNEAIKEYLQRH